MMDDLEAEVELRFAPMREDLAESRKTRDDILTDDEMRHLIRSTMIAHAEIDAILAANFNPRPWEERERLKASIIAMTPAEFREWCRGKHRSTYTRERQWRTDDRNARKLAAREAGEPWGPNDDRVG